MGRMGSLSGVGAAVAVALAVLATGCDATTVATVVRTSCTPPDRPGQGVTTTVAPSTVVAGGSVSVRIDPDDGGINDGPSAGFTYTYWFPLPAAVTGVDDVAVAPVAGAGGWRAAVDGRDVLLVYERFGRPDGPVGTAPPPVGGPPPVLYTAHISAGTPVGTVVWPVFSHQLAEVHESGNTFSFDCTPVDPSQPLAFVEVSGS